MPATAGRVRMPANNRVHSSAALQTHGIWQSAIGYDPYAPTAKDSNPSDRSSKPYEADGGDAENAYTSFQGLLALARITGTTTDETRGACKKCGRVGHLTFQCRNILSVRDGKDDDAAAIEVATTAFNKIKPTGKSQMAKGESSEEEEDESDSSDSDADPEIEKIIAARFGKKVKRQADDEDSGEDEKRSSRRRGRSKKRGDGDNDDGDKLKEKRRRRSHRGSDDDDVEDVRRHRKDRKRRHRRSDDSSEESEDKFDNYHCHKRRNRRDDSGSDSDRSCESSGGRRRSDRHHRRRRKRSLASSSGLEISSSNEDYSRVGREQKHSGKRSKKDWQE